MNIDVLKFGGSSVSNNENLDLVSNKIIEIKNKSNNIVVVVSAQGKTTDKLIKEASELDINPNRRELDALIQVGEQISAAKLAIILNKKGYKSISLNAWQAMIYTNCEYQNAKIERINTLRIKAELEDDKIVIITGFQGVDKNNNITTLGRGGSDTSAVAIASALNAKHCYIFSDVDGIYTSDPRIVKNAEKLDTISYKEMQLASNEGAKVLHDRCVELAEKYDINIVSASTFNNNKGTKLIKDIEENKIKCIIKNDKILLIKININNNEEAYNILKEILKKKIKIGYYKIEASSMYFSIIEKDKRELLNNIKYDVKVEHSTKISVVGSGISNNYDVILKTIDCLKEIWNRILYIDFSAYKISIQFKDLVDNYYLNNLHEILFNHI